MMEAVARVRVGGFRCWHFQEMTTNLLEKRQPARQREQSHDVKIARRDSKTAFDVARPRQFAVIWESRGAHW